MRRWIIAASAAMLCAPAMSAAAPVSFQRDVRPVLKRSCEACHRDANPAGGFSVSSYATVIKGGDSGGRLVAMISGAPPRMPKAGPALAAGEVALIARWIAEGAKDDSGGAAGETWWSLKPLRSPVVPASRANWQRTPIDAFIDAKLAANGLTPSPEAGRRTLIRRLTLDLHGLTPSLGEIDAFEKDASPDAYEKLVDRLLASPRYGERWARHWLDVVHYGDTHGYDKDKPRNNAWPYRDYLISAFNSDKPYGRFAREQLAGDVLFPEDPTAVAATGFIAAGPWDFVGHQELRENTTDKKITRLLDRDDMVAATMSTFVSMTAHCARCHNHKFDPIPQEDYYRLQAVFAGVDRADRPYDRDPAVHRERQSLLGARRAIQIELQPLLDRVDSAASPAMDDLANRIQDAKLLLAHIGEPKSAADAEQKKMLQARVETDTRKRKELLDALVGPQIWVEIDAAKKRAADVDAKIAAMPKPEIVYAASNYFPQAGQFRPSLLPRPVRLLNRGSVESEGAAVTAGGLRCVEGLDAAFRLADESDEGARRAALASWIAARENVLTWRSIVNRVWHHHFGAGIADSPNDFGRMGSPPSHPELLDWLAVWFRDEAGGSLKKLHRLIVTSAAYRQTSAPRADGQRADAENRLLWRMNRTRLDAESVRDSLLAAAGKLDLTMGGPGVRMFAFKDDHSPVYDYARFDADSPGAHRRSIYRFVVRSAGDPLMDRLDCPDSSVLTPKRNTTLTAIQALALLNNSFVVRMSEHLAARVRESANSDVEAASNGAVRLVLGREPSAEESRAFAEYAKRHGLENLCRVLFNTNEFLFVD